MGDEIRCRATIGGATYDGRALLETSELVFRGDARLAIPFSAVRSVAARDGTLTVVHAGGTAAFALGARAETWAERIRAPKSVVDKLGVKPGQRVSVVGLDDDEFLSRLRERAGTVSVGRAAARSDAIFYGAATEASLARVATLARSLAPAGALWVVRPKGKGGLSERSVMAAGKAAGLVDVKVVAFSATHTAEKFVIPVAKRRA
jgi:hypothetical protein